MAEFIKKSSAGTMESSDVYVEIEPGANGIEIELESVVKLQFGQAIMATVHEVLDQFGIINVRVHIIDSGALDCVIRSRVETAIKRGEVF